MGRKKQPLKPGPPSQPLRAQGKGGRKRIPTSAFDPAAGAAIAAALEPEKTFTVEKLVASRLKSGVKEYLVRWEGYGDKHDSWEPMENLSNLVEEMAAFDLAKEKETCRRAVRSSCGSSTSSSGSPPGAESTSAALMPVWLPCRPVRRAARVGLHTGCT